MKNATRALIAVAIVTSVMTEETNASRRFTGTEEMIFSHCESFTAGQSQLGVSAWLRFDDTGPATQVIIDNRNPLGLVGFSLTRSGNTISFEYETGTGFGGPLSAMIDLDQHPLDPSDWFHVAGEISTTGSITVELIVNDSISASDSDPGGGGTVVGADALHVGDALAQCPAICDFHFHGEIHDIGITGSTWDPADLDRLVAMEMSFLDAVQVGTPLFNSRLRRDLTPELCTGCDPCQPAIFDNPDDKAERKIGPPLTYDDQPSTMVVIGDTQNLDAQEMLELGTFLGDYAESLNIEAIFHVGDWDEAESARAMIDQFSNEDVNVPYALTLGNHDMTGVRSTPPFVEHLPMSDIENQAWHDDSMDDPPNDVDRYTYSFEFELDGAPQIGVVVPWAPAPHHVDFLRDTAERHSDKPVWLVTHMHGTGSPRDCYFVTLALPADVLDPATLTLDHYTQIPNLRSVFSGHLGSGAGSAHHCFPKSHAPPPPGDFDATTFHSFFVNAQNNAYGTGQEDGRGYLQFLEATGADVTLHVETYIALEDWFYEDEDPFFHYDILLSDPCSISADCDGDGVDDRHQIQWSEPCNGGPPARDRNCNGILDCVPGDPCVCEFVVHDLVLSEIRIVDDATTERYVEFTGAPDTSLEDVYYIVIGDGVAGTGVPGLPSFVELAVPLSGTVPADGVYLIGDILFNGDEDLTADLQYDPLDNQTHMLVQVLPGETINVGDPVDVDADGEIDDIPTWVAHLTSVAFLYDKDNAATWFGTCYLGKEFAGCAGTPEHAYRCDDVSNDLGSGWLSFDTVDTPGADNSECFCRADVNGDGIVSQKDIILIVAAGCTNCHAREDLDGDCIVGINDILIATEHFNRVCP